MKNAAPDPRGLACALGGLLLWGLSPIYWKQLANVPTMDTLLHRILWSVVMFAPWAWLKRRDDALAVLRDKRALATLCATTALIGANWFGYLWAVNNGLIVEASLGYFISPLLNIALGGLVFGERLTRPQKIAVALAAGAVAILLLSHGRPPTVALFLAATFSSYAVLRKLARVDAPLGLALETFLLAAPCAVLLARGGGASFFHGGWTLRALLVGSVIVTGLPLLLYTEGARRLDLKTLGILQYIAPSCQLALGALVYGEPVEPARVRAFILIWCALALYTFDMLRSKTKVDLNQ